MNNFIKGQLKNKLVCLVKLYIMYNECFFLYFNILKIKTFNNIFCKNKN